MTIKERIIEQLDELDEVQLAAVEEQIKGFEPDVVEKREKIERQLEALRAVTGIITDPEDVAAFEEATKRRPFFGSHKLDIEP